MILLTYLNLLTIISAVVASFEFRLRDVRAKSCKYEKLALRELAPVFQKEVAKEIRNQYNRNNDRTGHNRTTERHFGQRFRQTELEEMLNKKASAGQTAKVKYEFGQLNYPLVKIDNKVKNAFIATVLEAYSGHLPLELSPDDFWVLISQGVAQYLGGNKTAAEHLRHKFVDHEGKKQLEIEMSPRQIGPPGSPKNKRAWPIVIDKFGKAIKANTKTDISTVMTKGFSTSGNIEKAVMSATLMETMKNYFEYKVGLTCGIPKITLHGTLADYSSIIGRIDKLKQLFPDLAWWLKRVRSHMVKIRNTVRKRRPDVDWWHRIITEERRGSGSRRVLSGWAGHFIPFIIHGGEQRRTTDGRIDYSDIAYGVSATDVIMQTKSGSRERWQVKVVSGFLGTHQDPVTQSLRPALGWMTYFDETSDIQGQPINSQRGLKHQQPGSKPRRFPGSNKRPSVPKRLHQSIPSAKSLVGFLFGRSASKQGN